MAARKNIATGCTTSEAPWNPQPPTATDSKSSKSRRPTFRCIVRCRRRRCGTRIRACSCPSAETGKPCVLIAARAMLCGGLQKRRTEAFSTAMSRIMIVAPSWVGDALLSQPLFTLLKRSEPEAAIDVLAPSWALPVFRRMPEVADIIESPFTHGELALRKRLRLGRSLRARNYTRAYVLPNSFKSALVPLFARIPQRIGFVGEARRGLLTDARRLDKRALPPMVEQFAGLALAAGARITPESPHPRLQAQPAERDRVIAELGLEGPARLVCLCPGAEYGPAKRWPPE